jgi:hypothetical protein
MCRHIKSIEVMSSTDGRPGSRGAKTELHRRHKLSIARPYQAALRRHVTRLEVEGLAKLTQHVAGKPRQAATRVTRNRRRL